MVARTPGSPGVATVCATIEQARHHGIANTQVDPRSGTRTIAGVAPDGTRAVVVRSARSSRAIPVRRGEFVLRDSALEPPDEFVLRRRRSVVP
ncbi:MAG: hypothetical protein JST08_01645 [Actinobacteria bacterium]|nr:hypothetical protein [Actinomycetota bacterium]